MYTLSKLPIEILYSIMDHLDTSQVITMARLNSWYAYRLSTVISERISQNVKSDGWRIHVGIDNRRIHVGGAILIKKHAHVD